MPREFREMMDLPHRRPAYGVNGPAIFRHIGYRFEHPQQDPLRAISPEASAALHRDFIRKLNPALSNVQRRGGAKRVFVFNEIPANTTRSREGAKSQPLNSDEIEIDSRRTLLNELKSSDFAKDPVLGGWRIRLRVDVHSEYYFVTLILDQPNDTNTYKVAADSNTALRHESALAAENNVNVADVESIINFFYEQAWERFDQFTEAALLSLPGTRFTEFRAVALRDMAGKFAKRNAIEKAQAKSTFVIGDPTTDSDFTEARNSLHNWINRNGPFVLSALKFNQLTHEIDRDANCVLCEVLHGGAIYGSSLGQFPTGPDPVRNSTSVESPPPLRYFIVHNDLSKYQLGRLIRRTHVLGQLRTATVFDLDLIGRASTRIRTLGNRIDSILREHRLKSHASAGRPTTATQQSEETTLTPGELREIQEELYALGSSDIPGGLTYRVARSRYYADLFRTRVEEMRIVRLEGWEPYGEFVKRNLQHVFDFIGDVGTRHQALAERVHRLVTHHNAERLNSFQGNMRRLVGQLTKANHELVTLQHLGDIVGGAAFTYYAGQIIAEMVAVPKILQEEFVPLLSYALALLCWMVIRHRIFRRTGHQSGPGSSSAVRPDAQ